MSRLRIVAGPEAMFVDRAGVRSETRQIGENDHVKAVAKDLWETIRRAVSFSVWVFHRTRMARQRRYASKLEGNPWYRGPRPDLVSIVPWKDAKHGEWTSVPHGVAERLLRRMSHE